MKRARYCALALLAVPGLGAWGCGQQEFEPAAVERNRVYAEILSREDRRTVGEDTFFETRLADDADPQVQQWCAVALGRIGDPSALPLLYRAARGKGALLRGAAAFAIGEIEDRELLLREGRSSAWEAPLELRRLLDDTSPCVRARAIEALGKVGGPEAAGAILRTVSAVRPQGDPAQRQILEQAVTSLMRLKAGETGGFLIRLSEDPDPELQWRAENALIRLDHKGAKDTFLRLLDSPHMYVRAYAARGVGICEDPQLAGRLEPLLGPSDPRSGERLPLAVRVCAARSLGSLGSAASVAAIRRALESEPLDDGHPEQQLFAIQAAAALAQIASEEAERVLVSLLEIQGPVSDAALVSLGRLLRNRPDRFFELTASVRLTKPAPLRAWAQALGEVGGDAADLKLRRLLVRAAEEDSYSAAVLAIPTVLASLGRLNPPDFGQILQPFLASHDPVILRAAVAAYRPLAGDREAWRPVADAYRNIADATDPETKVAVLDRLEPWVSEKSVRDLLVSALRDRTRNARIAAARLLRNSGVATVPTTPGPADVRATDITYRLLAGARRDRTVAIIETSRGAIEIELFREEAPMTVDNFRTLARHGFYDGLTFMRVVPFFVIQGGDPRNDMEGGPGYSIRCEINMRPFERGSVGMALAGKDTGGSQFFITLASQPHLDGGYTCFGRVIAGMPVAERIVPGDRIIRVTVEEDFAVLDRWRY